MKTFRSKRQTRKFKIICVTCNRSVPIRIHSIEMAEVNNEIEFSCNYCKIRELLICEKKETKSAD